MYNLFPQLPIQLNGDLTFDTSPIYIKSKYSTIVGVSLVTRFVEYFFFITIIVIIIVWDYNMLG